jgi:hypothetical protein
MMPAKVGASLTELTETIFVTAALAKEGKVEVGTAVVVPDSPDTAKPPAPAKK